MAARKRVIEYGQYMVSHPGVYGGDLSFKGTRIPVKDVLYMLVKGWDLDRISAAYAGRINHEAIAEAISLARDALMKQTEKRRRAA